MAGDDRLPARSTPIFMQLEYKNIGDDKGGCRRGVASGGRSVLVCEAILAVASSDDEATVGRGSRLSMRPTVELLRIRARLAADCQ